ncbi:glycine cleavage system H protein-like protein [Periconia macrospinosa]|uniref:Glycine cleavage system H protein n=1 Tax=Periconia macrospinosa TaxID=97972 RepID=A0A2V1DFG8_9PLEO|nr:glycine cleavage system H protein-like protein [Periconia macrospinosa]
MASRLSAARAVRQLTSSATRRPSAFVCQRWQQRPQIVERRLFSVSAAIREKKYTEDHEWIELSEDGTTGTIGISTYAAKALGDVVYVELPQVDMDVVAGDTIGAVESVKSASDILSPISGVVAEVNSVLEEKPQALNKDPEGESWIAKVKVEEGVQTVLESLMDKKAYEEFTKEE